MPNIDALTTFIEYIAKEIENLRNASDAKDSELHQKVNEAKAECAQLNNDLNGVKKKLDNHVDVYHPANEAKFGIFTWAIRHPGRAALLIALLTALLIAYTGLEPILNRVIDKIF